MRMVKCVPRHHLDTVTDGTHADTQSTPCALLCDVGQVGLWVKGDGLVSQVIADHVTLATVDTHVLLNQCHNLLLDIQLTPCSDTRQSTSNNNIL